MLIGISLGPGDPELLTYKAVKALEGAKKVFVPGEMAADIVSPYAEPEILEFPMISDKKRLEEIWAENADRVASYASRAPTAFACIGDVNTFSTFSHLKRVLKGRHPKIEVHRKGHGAGLICARDELLAVTTDEELNDDLPQYALDDAVGLADFLELRYLDKAGKDFVALYVNGTPVRLNDFVKGIFSNILLGMVSSLKRVPKAQYIEIALRRRSE